MISIAMTYYNRFNLLANTLRSISKYTIPDEIIIVDDASTIEPLDQKSIDLISCGMNVKLFRFEPEEKTWRNPCIAFNKSFSLCSNDIIIIQNSECYHKNDIVGYCKTVDFEKNYYVFGCYSLPENAEPETHELKNKCVNFCGDDGWYQHSKFRNLGFHFTSAISKKNLLNISGFDENYGTGISYDDNEFLFRINKKYTIIQIDDYITYHQFHYSSDQSSPYASNIDKFNALKNGTYIDFKSSLMEIYDN